MNKTFKNDSLKNVNQPHTVAEKMNTKIKGVYVPRANRFRSSRDNNW